MIYVVSWISFFDNELYSEIVEAKSEQDAINKSKQNICDYDIGSMSLQDMKQYAFDCDGMINVIEI